MARFTPFPLLLDRDFPGRAARCWQRIPEPDVYERAALLRAILIDRAGKKPVTSSRRQYRCLPFPPPPSIPSHRFEALIRHGESAGTNRSVYTRALTVRDKSQATKNGTLTRRKKERERERERKERNGKTGKEREKKFTSPFHDGRAMDSRIAALRAHVKERAVRVIPSRVPL